MSTDKPKVAFLGTGIMGAPMCMHLLAADYPLTVWNRTTDKVGLLESAGAIGAASAAIAVEGADIVVIMLSSGPVVTEILMNDEVVNALQTGSVVVVMSSIPVETSRDHSVRLQKRGVSYVDAPVSGGEKGAIDGTLTIMAGGSADDIQRIDPVLSTMGRVTHVGPVGSGQLAKLANQTIVGITIDAVAEALLLAKAGGADLEAVREALLGGFADSTILKQHGERMISGNFEPGGKARTQLKDLRTSRELAESLGLDLPVLKLTESLYAAMVESGRGDLDHSALYVQLADTVTSKVD